MRLSRRAVAPAAAIIAAAGALGYLQVRPGSSRPAPFLVVDERGSRAELDAAPGVVAVTSMVTLRVNAPFTLLRVAPLRTDPDVELVAVRVLFAGRSGSHTASGYRRINDNPANACGNSPVTGYGPTYPVENFRLRPGDNTLKLVYYTRSQVPGRRAAFGYDIRYRTPDGHTGHASGENMEIILTVYQPGSEPKGRDIGCPYDDFTTPMPGYPS